MRITFEPGDGSFDIILDENEELPEEWNIKGVAVYRASGNESTYHRVKKYNEIIPR